MNNTVAVGHSVLSSGASSFISPSKFYFPAKFRRTAFFGGNPIQASATSESVTCKSLLCGRRALLCMATVSVIMPCYTVNTTTAATIPADDRFRLKEEIRKVLSKGKAAGVLRLVFHDAGTFEIDEKIGVSWADIIALAGAEAVSLCGGPTIPIQLGRIDSAVPDPEGKLPEESLDAASLKECFKRKGFSTQELVALSGAHTLGSKGFGDPTGFDNAYFKILMEKPWLSAAGMTSMVGLPSDRALVEDDECVRWISKYAEDQSLFFEDFKNAYTKLVDSGATWKKSL